MESKQEQEIARLRALNLSPKQIARKLDLRPSVVTDEIRRQAQKFAIAQGGPTALAPIEECWVNENVGQHFFNHASSTLVEDMDELSSGLAIVTVTRKSGYNRFIFCKYLVDYWCLGIKNTLGPQKLNAQKYTLILNQAYEAVDGKRQKITLEQAQSIVFSAEEYAANLGFKPHKDFEKCREHLGNWDKTHRIECGKDGKPFYFCGPYDDSSKILATLNKNAGKGNFEFVSQVF